jgi:hypothetical protein
VDAVFLVKLDKKDDQESPASLAVQERQATQDSRVHLLKKFANSPADHRAMHAQQDQPDHLEFLDQ